MSKAFNCLLIGLAALLISCGETGNLATTIFIDEQHEHPIEILHNHSHEGEHHHSNEELMIEIHTIIENKQSSSQPTSTPNANQFETIIELTFEILEMKGGRELLEIAIRPNISPNKKAELILLTPNTEAKTKFLTALLKHETKLTALYNELTNETIETKTPQNTNGVISTIINPVGGN